ncbi:NAD(P)/FAD-dependent oxidoreductase [Tundrisphaera lichenicola]|uniref:NAD(P)/FAD-dependent oxidoreductase n=1 Tax=Tundrisphaera lichenicola TaxID=2029860 RepID=UPI003EB69DF0
MIQRSSDSFDVVIAGAGLSGSSLALQLARRGMSVALVDPGRFPRDKVCGEFLSPECWGILDRLGLAEAVTRSCYHPIHLVRISTPEGREITADISGADGLPGLGLSRSFLDDLIVGKAREAGVEVFEGTRVGGAILEKGRVVGIHARGPEPMELRASLTIAADGRHSVLVKQTGRTKARSWFRPGLFGLKRHYSIDDPEATEHPGTVGLHLIPGGYGGTCRIEGGSTNLCALLPESEVRERRGDLDRLAIETLGRNPILARLLASGKPLGDWKTVAGVRVQVSTPERSGILYVGDSQGTVDPLGGQGMTMALLGAEVMVPFVERALDWPDSADFWIQADCQEAWHRRFDRRVLLCRAFHHILVNPRAIDLSSSLGSVASRVLASCFHQTRDRKWKAS